MKRLLLGESLLYTDPDATRLETYTESRVSPLREGELETPEGAEN